MFWFGNKFIALKRMLGGVLVAILSIGYSLGLSFDFQGVYYDPSSYVTYSFYDSTKKIGKNEFLSKNKSYDIHLARNEYEACQIAIRSKFNSTYTKYTIEFSDFTNENGDKLETKIYQEKYINCISDKNYGTYPDALIPYTNAEKMVLKCQLNHPFYIQVHAGEDTPAGTYTANVTVKNYGLKGNDETPKIEFAAQMTATVWDFTLPETPTCDTAFGLNRSSINKVYYAAGDPERSQQLYEKYYEFLLDRKISPYTLPYDILSDEADAYMSDPRVKSFLIPYSNDDSVLQAYYQKVQSNPEWAKKGYFYPIDEPSNLEVYQSYMEITDRLNRLCPGYNMVTPANTAGFEENGQMYYTAELQSGRSNILCGQSNLFDSEEFINQAEARRADGSKIWWYVCCLPRDEYCNVFIHWEGIKGRMLLWQQKSLNIEGLLYWDTTYWHDVMSPWADPLTTPWTGNDTFGDGSLFYNGQDGPISTLRLEEISDGIDDYEYLTIAEQLFGRDYVDKKIAKVTHTLTDYTLNDSVLASVRVEIGTDIENALKNQ